MSDYKSAYSDISKDYIEVDVKSNLIDQERYNRSKKREERNNINWLKQKVNLNEVVDKFISEKCDVVTERTESGVKYNFEGSRYVIKCDKVAGYLRIYDKVCKSYCMLDGTPSRNQDETHFKIKKREEM
jgi:hypothetical protein